MESSLTTYGDAGAGELSQASTGPDSPAQVHSPGHSPARSWVDLLSEAIESEILPRLLSARDDAREAGEDGLPNAAQIEAFVCLIINDDIEQVRAVADRVIVRGGGREALLDGLLTPAARRLGVMWERDECDFMTVTLGVYRLDQVMKETATASGTVPLSNGFEHRVLLLPAPGEQHSFGLAMVADGFREGGWCVRSGAAVSRAQLLHLVRDEWFDVVGLSVSAERWLKGLPSCIRALRLASCNPNIFLMLGGQAIVDDAERTRFLGADATAKTARDALREANKFMDSTVTARLRRVKAQQDEVGCALAGSDGRHG
jgi:methanogenic corrinoid protein MtbC1